ncbi:hypothetical protein Tco_0562608 [Tanacetum coccineum]
MLFGTPPIDTFIIPLNSNDQDALDVCSRCNFLDKMPQEAASLEDKMTIKMNQMMSQMKALVVTPAPVKAVEEVCVTCGSNHNFNNCPLTRGGNDFPVFQDNIQQFQQTGIIDSLRNDDQSLTLKCVSTFHYPTTILESLKKLNLNRWLLVKSNHKKYLDFPIPFAYNNPSPDFDPDCSTSSPTLLLWLKGDISHSRAPPNSAPLPPLPNQDKFQKSALKSTPHLRICQAIAWKLSDIRGIDPEFCSHKILLEDDYQPSVQHQRRVNPKIQDDIRKEVEKLLDARIDLCQSRLKIFSGKLKSRWSGPFTITEVYPYGTAKLSHADGSNFKVNCHRLKHYYGGDTPPLVIQDFQTFPKDN